MANLPNRPLSRQDLDHLPCDHPGCDHSAHAGHVMHVHSACHTGAPLTAAYQDGVLIISCYICDREVIRVAVADTPEHPSLYLEPLTPPSVN